MSDYRDEVWYPIERHTQLAGSQSSKQLHGVGVAVAVAVAVEVGVGLGVGVGVGLIVLAVCMAIISLSDNAVFQIAAC
jgi:hypothetical protein